MKKPVTVMTVARPLVGRHAVAATFAVCLLASALLVGACSKDADPTFPVPPNPQPQNWLFDVFGTAANNIYVCGNKGAMFHFDGSTWTAQATGTTAPITSLWGPNDGSAVYAVGHGGRIWRTTGGSWSGMDSGTSQNLYGIGSFNNEVYAVGFEGTIRRLNGSSWSAAAGSMFILDETGNPTDTLMVTEDVASLITVNHYFLGGSYNDPKYDGPDEGIAGTKGMVLAANVDPLLDTPWILRPLVGADPTRRPNEWVLATSSDPVATNLGRNYLGTSEGWLFQLTVNDDGINVWEKFFPAITSNPAEGINAIWVDASANAYMATDEGEIVYQSADYSFVDQTGERVVLFTGRYRLTGIWGTGPDNIYFVGFDEETILHGVHDQGTHTFDVTEFTVDFADKAAVPPRSLDHLDRPLR